jgi:hypothetical protein
VVSLEVFGRACGDRATSVRTRSLKANARRAGNSLQDYPLVMVAGRSRDAPLVIYRAHDLYSVRSARALMPKPALCSSLCRGRQVLWFSRQFFGSEARPTNGLAHVELSPPRPARTANQWLKSLPGEGLARSPRPVFEFKLRTCVLHAVPR